ncbi:MAG TPA: heavy-metal-associated domain-containing protein [Burkholderiaceae bacterium]
MMEFLVTGMSCGHCASVIREAVTALDPAAVVDVDLGTSRVRIDSELDESLLSQAIVDAGYAPTPVMNFTAETRS